MTKDVLLEYLKNGREIEFQFKNKMYSITQGILEGEHIFSFCEFYKETTEVETPDEVLEIKRDGMSVREMLNSISDDDIWIY